MSSGASGRVGRSGPNGTHKTPRSAVGDLSAGKCAACSGILPTKHMGRPLEYCSPECSEAMRSLRRLQRAVEKVGDPSALRSLIVSEVLNRLPVDREALSQRARRQARGSGGRFL